MDRFSDKANPLRHQLFPLFVAKPGISQRPRKSPLLQRGKQGVRLDQGGAVGACQLGDVKGGDHVGGLRAGRGGTARLSASWPQSAWQRHRAAGILFATK